MTVCVSVCVVCVAWVGVQGGCAGWVCWVDMCGWWVGVDVSVCSVCDVGPTEVYIQSSPL